PSHVVASLSRAEQNVHRELSETLLGEPATRELGAVERLAEQRVAMLRRVRRQRRRSMRLAGERRDERLDLPILAPLPRALAKDQVGAHAAAREIADAAVVLRPIRVRVEVTRPVVADLFEKLHEPERRL